MQFSSTRSPVNYVASDTQVVAERIESTRWSSVRVRPERVHRVARHGELRASTGESHSLAEPQDTTCGIAPVPRRANRRKVYP